jgi:hypothetical protein
MSDLSLPRIQHIVASGCVLAVGAWVTYLSYTQQPAEAFLFPRLISTVFLVLAAWTFAKACMGWTKVGAGVSGRAFARMLPGLIVMLVYVFWAAKALGFYTETAITFFILFSLYDPAPHGSAKSWIKRVVATGCFILVMYMLFAVLLKVFTPREVFF